MTKSTLSKKSKTSPRVMAEKIRHDARANPAPANPRLAAALKASGPAPRVKHQPEPEGQTPAPLETVMVPLNMLKKSAWNARKTAPPPESRAELVASIRALGVLNPLLVQQVAGGRYAIIAGEQRYEAQRERAEDGEIADDTPVPCRILPDEINALEVSIAENVVRAPMHPADEADAFSALASAGLSAADIALRFGVSESIVKKRFALAGLSDEVMTAFREGKIELAQAQAFTVSKDAKRQNRLLQDGGAQLSAPQIRKALTEGKVPATDPRAVFVGAAAYEAAGGTITRDDFFDETSYFDDPELLQSLAQRELESHVAAVKAEGWSWAKGSLDPATTAVLSTYRQAEPKIVKLSVADTKDLAAHRKALEKAILDGDAAGIDNLDRLIASLEDRMKEWPDAVKKTCGAIVALEGGRIEIYRGLITEKEARKQDRKHEKEAGTSPAAADAETEDDSPDLSAKLLDDLALQRSAATGAALALNDAVALDTILHALALQILYPGDDLTADSCLRLRVTPAYRGMMHGKGSYKGLDSLNETHDKWRALTPKTAWDLWPWLRQQPFATKASLLSYLVGAIADDTGRAAAHPDAANIRDALGLDMAQWFTPTAANTFSRMNRRQLLDAVKEMGETLTPEQQKMKKDALADIVFYQSEQNRKAGKPWLPQPLRAPAQNKAEE